MKIGWAVVVLVLVSTPSAGATIDGGPAAWIRLAQAADTLREARRPAPQRCASGRLEGGEMEGHAYIGAVQEPDECRVDVPDLVRLLGTDANLRLGGMHASSETPPSALAYEPTPRRCRREDTPQALREDSEGPCRDVTILRRGDHLPDRLDLTQRDPIVARSRSTRSRPMSLSLKVT